MGAQLGPDQLLLCIVYKKVCLEDGWVGGWCML